MGEWYKYKIQQFAQFVYNLKKCIISISVDKIIEIFLPKKINFPPPMVQCLFMFIATNCYLFIIVVNIYLYPGNILYVSCAFDVPKNLEKCL